MVVNNDTLFALWYQRDACTLESKMFNGAEWSTVNTIFKDKYFSPQSASYVLFIQEAPSKIKQEL